MVEPLAFERPKTKQLVELLTGLGVAEQKVLLLTADHHPHLYLSGRNLPHVHVMRFRDVTAYEVLWSDVVVVEETVFESGTSVEEESPDA